MNLHREVPCTLKDSGFLSSCITLPNLSSFFLTLSFSFIAFFSLFLSCGWCIIMDSRALPPVILISSEKAHLTREWERKSEPTFRASILSLSLRWISSTKRSRSFILTLLVCCVFLSRTRARAKLESTKFLFILKVFQLSFNVGTSRQKQSGEKKIKSKKGEIERRRRRRSWRRKRQREKG